MKEWYNSKTLWFNVIAIIAIVAQAQFGFFVDASCQAAILATVNLILRAITGEGLEV